MSAGLCEDVLPGASSKGSTLKILKGNQTTALAKRDFAAGVIRSSQPRPLAEVALRGSGESRQLLAFPICGVL